MQGMVAAAIAIWRLQCRLERAKMEDGEPPRWLARQLQSARDALAEVGIEARDHTTERYVPGLALSVLAFQPTAGATIEVVAETIKPSVFFKGVLVQPGEVIVASPSTDTARESPPPAAPSSPGATPFDP